MKLKAVRIIYTLLIASVLSTGIIALPVQNAYAEDNVQIENADEVSSDAVVYSAPVYVPSSKIKGTWIKESNGRWWYRHTDGSYTKYDWEYIDGSWYFFDSNGWMWTEWLKWEGSWYYLNPSGVMHTGWLKDDGKWYYFTMRGIMQTGWIKLDADWYYLGTDGVMQTGWKKINGSWYYLGSTGKMNTDVLIQGQREYCFYTTGEMYYTRIVGIRIQQEREDWCWAACAAMVGTYNTTSKITQRQVVENCPISAFRNTAVGISWGIVYASNHTKDSLVNSNFKYQEIVNKIDENKPMVLNMLSDGRIGHAMVCSGYMTIANLIYITDPESETTTNFYSYNNVFTDGILLGERTYTCANMVIY